MVRIACWLFCALGLVATACTPDAATGQGELSDRVDEITPVPTVSIDEITALDVVIAPTPIPEGPRPLVVATLLGETGVMAPLDGPALVGVAAEIDRLNEAGGLLGRPIELLRFDTNSRASLVERFAERLAEDPPDLLITSCDTEFSAAALEIADEAGIVTISPCADDARYLTGALGSRNFTMGAPAEPRGALAAAVSFERFGPTAIVLRDLTSPEAIRFCDGFERSFRELGGSVIYRDEFRYDTLEPVQDRLAARDDEPAFITLCSHVPGENDAAPSIIAILRTLGFQAPIVAGSSVDEREWFQLVPALGELLYISWSSAFGNDPDERVNDIVNRGLELDLQTDEEDPDPILPGVSTILGAEAIEAWSIAVESARDVSSDRVASALGSFSNTEFSTGEVSFTIGARMDSGRTYRVLQVLDGELSVIALEQTDD